MVLTFTPPLPSKDNYKCPRCHAPWTMIIVHGHEQCAYCKSNILECCSGEVCETKHISSSK